MQTEGVRGRLSAPKLPFLWEGSHSPSLPLMPRRGTSFSPKMRKGSKRIIWGWHLDTPSEIILQASLRMHFDGGQGSFFNALQQTAISSLFPRVTSPLPLTKRVDASIQQRNSLPDRKKPDKLEG